MLEVLLLLGCSVALLCYPYRKWIISIVKTETACPYGVYISPWEAIRHHFWYVLKSEFFLPKNDQHYYEDLLHEVKQSFLEKFKISTDPHEKDEQVIIAHSCRSIFYHIIQSKLNIAQKTTGKAQIRICTCGVQFGSFYKLLRSMEKSLEAPCQIDTYQIDLNKHDWTLNVESIDEEELKKCDILLAQNLFGVPLEQTKLFELSHKHGITIVEDCVQSGSLFGKYKGHPLSDAIFFSGGVDKTPSCFGAGFGYFRSTTSNGRSLFVDCNSMHEKLPMDTSTERFTHCANQMLHLIMAKNTFGVAYLLAPLSFILHPDYNKGDRLSIPWSEMTKIIRLSGKISPFPHAKAKFLRRPGLAQLLSMRHGLSKVTEYHEIAKKEVEMRKLLLSCIPKQYHSSLFPWLTPKILNKYEMNGGISEFSWVHPILNGTQADLCHFLNDHLIINLINTTWRADDNGVPISKSICDNLVYLPNLNEMNATQVKYVGRVLTEYCHYQEAQKLGH